MALTTKYCSFAGAGLKDGTTTGNAWDWPTFLTNAIAGDVVLVKGGETYSRTTTADTPTAAGTATSPIVLQGCDASWNVLTPTRTNGNGPLIVTDYPDITYSSGKFTTKAFVITRALKITASASTAGAYNDAVNSTVTGCRIENSGTSAGSCAIYAINASNTINNDALLTSSSGGREAIRSTSNGRILFNRVTCSGGNTVPGIQHVGTVATPVIAFNTGYTMAGHGIIITTTSGTVLLLGNTIADATGAVNGVHFVAGATGLNVVLNNQLTDCGGYGIFAANADIAIYSAFNRLTRNASGEDFGATDWLDATSFGNVTTAQAGADAAAQRLAEYVSPGTPNYDYRLKPESYAQGAGNLPGQAIGALQPVITLPAAADVQSGAADYGYAGALLDPSYAGGGGRPELRGANL